ncbi:MAG: formate--tetrahydrofolate ligase [Candidatus Ranarchaeia archaeon]
MPSDIEIAQSAKLKPITEIAKDLGLSVDDIEQYGKYKAKVLPEVYQRLKDKPDGKLIVVSAIVPTKTGEGKTTMSVGLALAMHKLNKRNIVVLRQPSLGPVFGIKGGAAGGGYSQVLPMEDINIHFTGDLHAITVAHNLLTAMLDNHIYRGNDLNIKSSRILWNRVQDIEDRSLRNIVTGLGGNTGGVPRESSFAITTASEVAAIQALATDLEDLKKRLSNIIVAYDKEGNIVKCEQLNAAGAMTLLLKDALKPNLVQTIDNSPAMMHGGPFANIAHGCPSITAIRTALKLTDYVIVEPGFGADLGLEKFCDIACRFGGFKPSAAVIVATIKALKAHGGVKTKLLKEENVDAVKKGLPVLGKMLENVEKFGLPPIVCMNHFPTDSDAEIKAVMDWCEERGTPAAFTDVVAKGSEGGMEFANVVLKQLESGKGNFKFLYDLDQSIEEKITTIAKESYGATGVKFTPRAKRAMRTLTELGLDKMPINMAKTPLSLTDNPRIKGRPEKFSITITDIRPSNGAGFLVAYLGDINTMPALPSTPAAEGMDIDNKGKIIGLS